MYKLTRTTLIKAIGEKGAEEYNRREYERLGEEGRKRQAEEYARWSQAWEKKRQAEEEEYKEAIESGAYWYWEPEPASMHEKIVKIRKGVLGSNGKPLTQRDLQSRSVIRSTSMLKQRNWIVGDGEDGMVRRNQQLNSNFWKS